MTELKTTSIMLTVEQWERLRDEAHDIIFKNLNRERKGMELI